jgi:tetratricopeptide (TPR) repeat protein
MSPIYLLALSWTVAYKTAPFAGWAMTVANLPPALPVIAPESAPLDFRGEMLDGDLPATYRLPPITSAYPTDIETAADSAPIFLPPQPAELDQPAIPESVNPPQWQQAIPPLTPAGSPPDDRVEVSAVDDRPTPTDVAPQPAAPMTSTTQLLPAVRRGYVLARRGALFAARTEFVQVLRRVAQAKDAAADSGEHSQALAAGLRAIDEAEDFIPDGIQLEAELDVRATASSHRTPALANEMECVLPHEAVHLYHQFAQTQLAQAVAGEQAGSMALYGLGRIDAQRAARSDDDLRLVQSARTMYAAALEACPHNHLAANELGVLECRLGRPAEAVRLFERTIDFAPTSTAYHNLAVAQQKLGLHPQAQANEHESQRLALWERSQGALSQRAGVLWVEPEEMARVAQPPALTTPPIQAANAQPVASPRTHVVWPAAHPSRTRWR